jgi:signal transduction histidine kinase
MQSADLPANESDRLTTLRALEVLDSGPEEEFDALIKVASLVCGVPVSLISLIDTERQWFKANIGLPGVTETPRDIAFCAHAILDDGLFEVPDASLDARFADNPLVLSQPDIRFYAGAPIVMADGSRIGTLCVIDRKPRELDDTKREILKNLAIAAAHALEGRRAIRALQKITENLAANEVLLKEARDSAQTANIAKSRFLATMSHEIRTPMNGVLGMAQLLVMPNLAEKERLEYAHTILNSGHTLMALLNDILDLSKIEAGKFQFEATEFEPAQLLGEVCKLFSGSAKAKGLGLDSRWIGTSTPHFLGDSHRLRQMLSNLVGNAIKFTHSGHVHIECRAIESGKTAALLEFSVSDSGIGIPIEKQGLLFKPFSQADDSTTREFGGSGLGLSLVSNLAKAMGGSVGVSSEPGDGARFWFRVPAKPLDAPQVGTQTEIHSATQGTAGAHLGQLQGHVLVAEDNPVNAIVIRSLLARLGVTMTLATNGKSAVDAIIAATDADQPDLILMDVHMPLMDGYAATRGIRQWEAEQRRMRLPIIALTADAFEEDRQLCLSAGMDDFLTKPIAFDVLYSVLAQWLKSSS